MQLLSMEVNQLGTGDRLQVGTLSAGLNAVCGRRGSGKSSLLRWLRGMIQPALSESSLNHPRASAGLEQATGRISLRLGDIELQLERAEYAGHTASKILRSAISAWNGDDRKPTDQLPPETLSRLQRDAFDLLASVPSGRQACDRLWELARELNLEIATKPRFADERLQLSSREHELTVELQPLEAMSATREGLLARRRQLEAELERARKDSVNRHYMPATDEHHRLADRLAANQRDVQKVRDEIADIDAAILAMRGGQSLTGDLQMRTVQQRPYRQRLLSLDAQLARWRNTLSEIRTHRERLEASATDAQLDGQLGEQFSPINQATPRLALRALEAQILEARRHFDTLLEGVDRYRTEHDGARNELPQTLRLMQRELHEVCQQLSRHESLTSNRATKEQILQLSRCESEMRLAIERLIAERGELLRTIATACHLSVDQVAVAYSDSCRCSDHPPLDAWLTAISSDGQLPAQVREGNLNLSEYTHQYDELALLESRRTAALARLEECERDQRETTSRYERLGALPVPAALNERVETDLLHELDNVSQELLRLETRERLRVELTGVRRRLQQLPRDVEDGNSLRGRYLRHASGLLGRTAELPYGIPAKVDLELASGRRNEAADQLNEVALRLAIVDLLAARGVLIPLTLDQTLDELDGPQRLTAVRYLTSVSNNEHIQVIALTEDRSLAEAVKAARGHVVPIVISRAIQTPHQPVESDVNRQLLAYANDFEADKWSYPSPDRASTPRQEPKRRFALDERSEIEAIPSVSPVVAARLRALGIDRVADFLNSDHYWLADNARIDSVTAEAVLAWQSEARLLCAMPQLRPFDARILSGAGVRDQTQLAEMHPSRLLERVERFLATERGRQIMRSGSTYELSRITAWIASAKRGDGQRQTHAEADGAATFGIEPSSSRLRGRRSSIQREHVAHASIPTYHIVERDDTENQPRSHADGEGERKAELRPERRRPRSNKPVRGERQRGVVNAGQPAQAQRASAAPWHFHLELTSPIVDAPSIGAAMASQLERAGIATVDDLLATDADKLANDLNLPRVTATTIRSWQMQSRLVCRIPNLRGHDAQILVACGITSPEGLSRMQPSALQAQAATFATSPQGQRVLRGRQAPNMAEVTNWIQWSSHSRAILAA